MTHYRKKQSALTSLLLWQFRSHCMCIRRYGTYAERMYLVVHAWRAVQTLERGHTPPYAVLVSYITAHYHSATTLVQPLAS
jgi:hypothetical protein